MIAQRAEFDFQPVDFAVSSREIRKLAGAVGLELLDHDLKTPRQASGFAILVGQDFSHRGGHCGFEPPRGEPHCAAVDKGHYDEQAQGSDKKSDREMHDRVVRGAALIQLPLREPACCRRPVHASPGPVASFGKSAVPRSQMPPKMFNGY